MMKQQPHLATNNDPFVPGQRIGIAVSGGADSVALLLTLLSQREALGLVLSVIHVHHGIRGEEADRDQRFVETMAATHDLFLHLKRVDTPAHAAQAGETLEEAARSLRYQFFGALMQTGLVDVVATAHTLDDQAETVIQKMLRGGWTEGLGGISPLVAYAHGKVLRPLISVTRAEVEKFLRDMGQTWCEDSTNLEMGYTRNRVRHELLPVLRTFNPQIASQLGHMAAIARDEEAYWQRELARIAPGIVLPGKPVRGGGRASSTHPEGSSVAMEIERLRPLGPAMQRRLLRWAAKQLDCVLDFDQTERLMQLCNFSGTRSGTARRMELRAGVLALRTAREIQLVRQPEKPHDKPSQEWELTMPGELRIPELGLVFRTQLKADDACVAPVCIRSARAGDRATPRYSSGPKRIKEILERMVLPAAERPASMVAVWPAEADSAAVIWLRGVELDPAVTASLPFLLEVAPLQKDTPEN